MVDFVQLYFSMVKSGKITIEKVPEKYRESVMEKLNE